MHTCAMNRPLTVGETAALPPEEAKHALRVMRLQAGDEVTLLDGDGGRYLGRLTGDGAAEVLEALPSNEAPCRLTLYQGLPKGDKMETVVQKLTELGASAVVPAKMQRCVAKWDGKDAAKKRDRLQRIADEAVKQCKRACAPCIGDCVPVGKLPAHELLLVPWEDAEGYTLSQARRDFAEAKDIAVLIGPEGGIAPEEIEVLRAKGARVVTLGPRILRTETAALTAAALVLHLWGDLS